MYEIALFVIFPLSESNAENHALVVIIKERSTNGQLSMQNMKENPISIFAEKQ